MTPQEIAERLRDFAARINHMWGKNPDADMVREAADLLDPSEGEPEEEVEETPKPKTSRRERLAATKKAN